MKTTVMPALLSASTVDFDAVGPFACGAPAYSDWSMTSRYMLDIENWEMMTMLRLHRDDLLERELSPVVAFRIVSFQAPDRVVIRVARHDDFMKVTSRKLSFLAISTSGVDQWSACESPNSTTVSVG